MWKKKALTYPILYLLLLSISGCSDLHRVQGLSGDRKIIANNYNINESEYFQDVQKGRMAHMARVLAELNAKAEEVKEENKVEHTSTETNEDGTTSESTWYEYPDVEVVTPAPPLAPAMAYLQMIDENILKGNKYIFNENAIIDFYNLVRGETIVEGEDMSFTVRTEYLPVEGEDYTSIDKTDFMAAKLFPATAVEFIPNRGYFIDSTKLYESFLAEAGYVDGSESGYFPGGDTGFIGNIVFDETLAGKVCAWAVSKTGLGYSQGESYHNAIRRSQCPYCKNNPGTPAGRFGATHYDCSGLVYCAYKAYGIDISWNGATSAAEEARGLEARGCQVGYSELAAGDLIFISSKANGRYKNITHVVMYLGDGKIVHAQSTKTGVRIDNLSIYEESSFRSIVRPSGLQ